MAIAPLTRRSLIATSGLIAAAGLVPAAPLFAQEAGTVTEMIMGDPNAPVTMIEYASFTCPHCANFEKDVLPLVKADFIDTGKVRLVYREVYFDGPSLWASMVARCAGEDRFFGVVDLLYKNQATWSRAADGPSMVAQLTSIGKQAGMTEAEVDACLRDEARAKDLITWFQANATADKINSTPTFIINGEKVMNAPYPELKAKIESKLGG